jgi:hypothetical protein
LIAAAAAAAAAEAGAGAITFSHGVDKKIMHLSKKCPA